MTCKKQGLLIREGGGFRAAFLATNARFFMTLFVHSWLLNKTLIGIEVYYWSLFTPYVNSTIPFW